MSMKYSFASLGTNILTRKFGGSAATGVAEPYVSGQFFVWFDKLPLSLPTYTVDARSGLSNNGDIANILAASCLSVTPPGGTLNSIEFTGLGGTKWTVPGNIDYNTSVSCKFLEFKGTPILDIFHSWVKMIRDYRLGISDVLQDNLDGSGYSKSTYSATMYYWTTAPDGVTVDYYACYDGIYPTKDPQDLYSGDVETVGRLDVEIEFKLDYAWHEKWVYNKCVGFAQKFASARDAVAAYNL
jgi:hypothetical protein